MYITDVETRFPELYALANRGSIFGYSEGKSITGQQKGDGSFIVYATSARDEHWMKDCGYDVNNVVDAKRALREEYHDWAGPLLKLIQVADQKDLTPRSLYMLPVGHRWDHRAGVTMIGDAAHLMTPHTGKGVNTAIHNSLNLANAIIRASKSSIAGKPLAEILDDQVRLFEEEMFARAAPVQRHSYQSTEDMFFTPGAPDSSVARYMRRMMSDHWLVRLWVPLWFVRFSLRLFFWWECLEGIAVADGI